MLDSKQTRMLIFDPCFGAMTGHWENYCKRLYQELKERGYQAKVFGQKKYNPDIVGEMEFHPAFTYSPYAPTRNILELGRETKHFLQDFNNIDENEIRDGDVLIFHSLFPHTFSAIIEWTKKLAEKKNIIATFFFQFPPSDTKHQVGIAKKIYFRLRRWVSGERLTRNMEWVDNNYVRYYQKSIPDLEILTKKSHILMASTDVLSRNFSALFGMKVQYLPMPGEKIANVSMDKPVQKNPTLPPKITIGYFGHSAMEKGGQFLQYFVEKTFKLYPDVEFILHINPNPGTEKHLAHFKTHKYSNVKCHYGHLEPEKMMELMRQVDIVLMPYSPKKYATTPSAIFTEGLPLQKIFVLPKNTWAYNEAVKYNAGVAGFKHYSEKAILKAIFKAIRHFSELRQKSIKAGVEFYNENNMENYINVFEQILKTHIALNEIVT